MLKWIENNTKIKRIIQIILDRDKKEGLHAGLLGSVRLINDKLSEINIVN